MGEMSRLESGVLGNALDGVPEEDDEANNSKVEDPSKITEEEKKEVEEKVGEALKENLVELEKRDDETETEKDGKVETNEGEKVKNGAEKADENQEDEDEDEGMDEGDESQEDSSNEQMETDKVTKEDEEKTEGKDGEEEPSNLQLAWEMLELAKVIYTKQVDTATDDKTKKAIEEKLCRTILTLGEISIENENYSQAVEDIQMCLKKQGAFSKDSRLVAETHYQLGVAQGFNAQYDAAVESLNSAIQIINVLVKSSEGKKETGELEASIYKKEIEELEELIPEIEEKIADTKDLKKEAEAKPQDAEKS